MLDMPLGSKSLVVESSSALFPSFLSFFLHFFLSGIYPTPFAYFYVNIHMISKPKCCHRLCGSAALLLLVQIPNFVYA